MTAGGTPSFAEIFRWDPVVTEESARRLRRRVARWLGLPVLALVMIILAGNVVFIRSSYQDMTLARSSMERAGAAIARSDLDRARAELDAAERRLASAAQSAQSWPLQVLGAIPVLGSPGRALSAVVGAAQEAVAAGRFMAGAAERLLAGGLGGLGQNLGSLHTAVTSAREDVARAAAHLQAARHALEGPVGAALPPVSNAARDVLTELDATEQRLSRVGDSLRLTGHLTEPTADVRLLFISQDPLELRPTGGLIGSYGVIRVANGTISLEEFSDAGTLPSPEPPMAAPPELAEHLVRPWNIINANWWPDFPTSARTAAEMFARHGKGRVDGVIAMTDAAVARLIGALGPIQLRDYRDPVVEDGFAERVIYEQVLKRPLDEPRKKFLADLARELFHRLLNLPEDKAGPVLTALGDAAAAGDLQLWFENSEWQRLLDPAVTGALPAADGDFLQLAEANMTAGKANIGIVRHADYVVRRDESGRLRAHLQIQYRNDAPKSDINPYYHGLVRVYVPRGSQLLDGPGSIFDAPDGPYSVLMTRLVVKPDGGTAVVAFDYLLPDEVAPDGHYRLTLIRQPGTGRDTYAVFVADRRFNLRSGERRLTVDVNGS